MSNPNEHDVMIEKLLERLMYASRWILAPIYLGLSLTLVALAIKFFRSWPMYYRPSLPLRKPT
ncbi:hypothetical protein [Paludibacterium denitrificans]|uniref:hypothetical protein n=1 Tax=Paludibacterium denitrificans TaxID=2675226 RepID=UPI001E4236C6|nr:hypothetical protein [Paludibacterium denitrificans]